MTSETYPSGRQVITEYDTAGRAAGIRAALVYYAGATASDATNRIQYASHGAETVMALGNEKWEHTNFNSRLQPTQIGLGTSGTDSSLLKLDYGYGTTTNNGNVTSQTITAPSLTVNQCYGYDSLNRLTSAEEKSGGTACGGTQQWKQVFIYDRFGNRNFDPPPATTQNVLGPNPTISTSTNRIASGQNYGYDNAGNLTSDPTTPVNGIVYDAENRQTQYTKSGQATNYYYYDGDGHRIKKIDSTGTTVFVYNAGGQLIAEYTAGNPASGGTSYLTSDHLGSTRLVVKSDGATTRHDYLPFGEEIQAGIGGRTTGQGYVADSVRQKFTQKERDSESGLDYFLARYYSSAQGRFTSMDPGNAGATRKDPQSWNGYSYSRNNPLKYVDPDGLKYKLTDLNGNSIDDYSDDDFNKNFRRNKSITLKNGNIYQNGDLIGHYQRLSFDDLGPFAQGVYDQLSARRNASYQAIGAFAGATAVGGGIAGGAAFLGGVALGGSSITTLGLEGAAEAANAAEAASLIAQAASTVGNQGARAGSRAVAEQAARDWVGEGAENIFNRQTGQIVGKISADGTRVARFTSASKAEPYINLVNKVTGGNLHIRF